MNNLFKPRSNKAIPNKPKKADPEPAIVTPVGVQAYQTFHNEFVLRYYLIFLGVASCNLYFNRVYLLELIIENSYLEIFLAMEYALYFIYLIYYLTMFKLISTESLECF